MRLIGHLPSETSASTFSDYLYVQGITNEIEREKEGWAVWIHSEDELKRAREILELFQGEPNDPKYRRQAALARDKKAREEESREAAEERVIDRTQVFRASMPYGVGALTAILIGISLAVQILRIGGYEDQVLGKLSMTEVTETAGYYKFEAGLHEIREGQVWRLITPIFLHGDWLHLLLNMMWLLDLGSMIEGRQSTGRLSLLVLVTAAASNLGQNWLVGPVFGGMSGVVYGLLGYVWMKGKFDPASGLALHAHTVAMMLIWFVLCFTPVVPHVANGAHAVGLALGVAWGFLASPRRA